MSYLAFFQAADGTRIERIIRAATEAQAWRQALLLAATPRLFAATARGEPGRELDLSGLYCVTTQTSFDGGRTTVGPHTVVSLGHSQALEELRAGRVAPLEK